MKQFVSRPKLLVLGFAMLLMMAFTPNIADARGPLYRTTYPSKITSKFWGGFSNVMFCWVEVPIEINREIQNTDPFTGCVVGFGKGLWFTGQRFVLGAVDMITFPFNIYGNNYQSIQRTEFPFIDEVE